MNNDREIAVNVDRRFGGIARLYGEKGLQALQQAHICVVGVGGVGSWVAEALARSAVGRITLIDMDHVAESNINRQLQAMGSTLGQSKIELLAERISDINPACEVVCVDEFLDPNNVTELITQDFDWVIDCIDTFRIKAALISHCRRRKQSILTVGGAGGRVDVSRVQLSDMRSTQQDALMATTRRQLRKKHGFSDNIKRRFQVPCVWSSEPARLSQMQCDVQGDSSLNCAGFGACMPVTATFAMLASAHVINKVTAVKLYGSKK